MNESLTPVQQAYIKEIRHKLNPRFYHDQLPAYKNFLQSLFDIKISGLDRIKELQEEENAVFKYPAPHKSNLDSPIIGVVLEEEGMNIPRYLAGSNLYFPFGPYIRRTGAVKVPREGNKDMVIASIYYVKQQFLKGNDIVNFPEGGRSKEGNLRIYKPGYFQSAIEAQLADPDLNLYVVPVSLVYERIAEDGTLQRSAERAKKHPKWKDIIDFISLARSRRAQRGERKSTVYLDFEEPFTVSGFIDGESGYAPRELGERLANFTREQALKNYKVVSTALLAKSIEGILKEHPSDSLEKTALMDKAQKLFGFLKDVDANVESILESGLEESIERGIEYFANRRKHKVLEEKGNELIVLRPEMVSFYANTIGHFFGDYDSFAPPS